MDKALTITEELVQLFIVSDGELQVAGDDTLFLVIAGSVAGKFEDFSSEILEDGSKVYWSTSTNTLSVVATFQKTMNTTNGELKSS